MNWYIGQDIVCIKTHINGVVKKDEVYIIQGLKQGCCAVLINVGVKAKGIIDLCNRCNTETTNTDCVHWLDEKIFEPLDSLVSLEEIEEVLNEPAYS